MPLQPGQRIAHYRVVEKIGEGGMGEVYRAEDTRLGRHAALKVLPEAFVKDASRLARLAREAQLLAALNHPNIAAIHGLEEADGVTALALELVDGETLADRIARGPIPLTEACAVALQIAEALEAAHEKGIVHRDLKPGNVKFAADGRVKVLDFGLAKAMEEDGGPADMTRSPTLSVQATQAGVILGTAAYMSPEQAAGRAVDRRADIWAFGVVLAEMLTRERLFQGDSVSYVLASVLKDEPAWDSLPAGIPAGIHRLLRRCLHKDPRRRLQAIGDARIEIEEALSHPAGEPAAAGLAAPAPLSRLPWIALAVLVPLAAALAWYAGSRPREAAPDPARQFILAGDVEVDRAHLSPDGTRIAYLVGRDLFIRSLDSLEARRIGSVGENRSNIFWSPDGRSLGIYHQTGELQRIDLDGGAPVTLAHIGIAAGTFLWPGDGHIYYTRFGAGAWRVPETGGAAETVLEPHTGMVDYHGLVLLPGGRGFVTLPHQSGGNYRQILLEVPGKEPRLLFESDSGLGDMTYSPTGHLLFHREENPRGLWAVPFSLARAEVTGSPFLVVPDLLGASVSARGDMVYPRSALRSGETKQQVVWTDRTGAMVGRLEVALYETSALAPSPDGSRLAVIARGVGRPSTGKPILWVIDLHRGTSTRLVEGEVAVAQPVWSEDGARVAYVQASPQFRGNTHVMSVGADGTGDSKVLFEADMISSFLAISPDWSVAAVVSGDVGSEKGLGIWGLGIREATPAAAFVDSSRQDFAPVLHPGGKWLAYQSGDFSAIDIIVRPFPTGAGQWKAAEGLRATSRTPLWSPRGDRLYYVQDRQDERYLMEVSFDDSGSRPVLGQPAELFKAPGNYMTVLSDDRFGFVVDEEPEEGKQAPDTLGIVLVENWLGRFTP